MSASVWNVIADGVYQCRYQPMDVSVVAIVGESGVILVDTRNNPAEADEVIADIQDEFGTPIVAVVNTHAHYDHTFGNQRFDSIPTYGHHLIPRHFDMYEAPRLAAVQADPGFEPDKNWAGVVLTPPNHLVSEPVTVDLGGRRIEILPLEPGHTDTDMVVFVPDQRVWILGDVIEESGAPMYGSGSFPLQWPAVLATLLEKIEPGDPVVPGHGAVVDREFVLRQMQDLQRVADGIRSSWAKGLSVDEAVRSHPASMWSHDMLAPAFARGYAHLE